MLGGIINARMLARLKHNPQLIKDKIYIYNLNLEK